MNKVIDILMKRDNITFSEAKNMINECRKALINGEDDAIEYYLGLEDDYIFDILFM